jgi:hypothetical protein
MISIQKRKLRAKIYRVWDPESVLWDCWVTFVNLQIWSFYTRGEFYNCSREVIAGPRLSCY